MYLIDNLSALQVNLDYIESLYLTKDQTPQSQDFINIDKRIKKVLRDYKKSCADKKDYKLIKKMFNKKLKQILFSTVDENREIILQSIKVFRKNIIELKIVTMKLGGFTYSNQEPPSEHSLLTQAEARRIEELDTENYQRKVKKISNIHFLLYLIRIMKSEKAHMEKD